CQPSLPETLRRGTRHNVCVRGVGTPARVAIAALIAAVIAIVIVVATSTANRSARDAEPGTTSNASTIVTRSPKLVAGPKLTVHRVTVGPSIAPGFVGLTMEYRSLRELAGNDPAALDPAFLQLLRAIAPDQRRVLRFGGDSTDWTWWPISHVRKPPGVRYSLTPDWMRVARALTSQLDARLIVGVNLEADNRSVAAGETRALVAGLGHNAIDAIEVGNEPELY